ncbi:MAG: FixH family protein [Bacteroidota bacterium]
MKWNWGTGIFIFIVFFLLACFTFLFYAAHQKFSLVEEDYYPKELRHEEKLVKMRNANALGMPLQVSLGKSDLMIRFPADLHGMALTGNINVYRPSDEKLDVVVPVAADTSLVQLIPLSKLSKGRYVVKVEWTARGKTYYKEQDVFIP